jgi:integrase
MGRRGNGEGSITRRKDGLYMGRYTIQTATGSKRKTLYAKTRKEAAEKLTKAMADRDGGLVFDAENVTLAEYLDRWLNDSVKGSVKPKTFESYEWLVRKHIVPALGRVKVRALSPAHLQGFYHSKLETGLSPRTVQYLHVVLHRALKQALRWGLVPRNVAEAVDPPKPQKDEIKPLTRDEARRLLDAAHDDRLEALYILAVHLGLRQGELLGLRWGDVNLEAGTLQVRRSLTVTKDGPSFTAPKTAKGRRSVKLTIRAVEALREHLQRQLAEIERMGDLYRDDGLIFSTTVGTPINPRNLTGRSFKPLLERAGLPKSVRFHDLRHTAATLLLGRGVHPKLVQELLGHATIAITLDTYSHVLPGMGDQTAAAMEDALS